MDAALGRTCLMGVVQSVAELRFPKWYTTTTYCGNLSQADTQFLSIESHSYERYKGILVVYFGSRVFQKLSL